MKKSGVCVLLAILLINLLFVVPLVLQAVQTSAQDDVVPGLTGDEALPVVSEIDKGKEAYEKYINETTWQYLGREWRGILLQNKVIASIDAFLTKFSIVFTILFGEPYSLSLALLIVIILWFYFFFKFSQIFCDFAALSKGVSIIIGFAMAVIMAQTKALRSITKGILWLIFERKQWYWRLIIAVLIIAVLLFLHYLASKTGKSLKERRKKIKEALAGIHQEAMIQAAEPIEKGLIEAYREGGAD